MQLDLANIMALLPHRPPLLLVHRFRVEQPGAAGVGEVLLDLDRPLWAGLTGHDLYPELVLEGAAQSLGVLLASARPPGEAARGRHLLLGFGETLFATAGARPVELDIRVRLHQRVGGICRGQFAAHGSGTAVAEGELTVMQG